MMCRAGVWLWAALLGCLVGVQAEYLETFPSGSWKVPEDTMTSLTLSLGFNASDLEAEASSQALLEVTVVADEDWKLDWVNRSAVFTVQEVVARVNKSVVFSGYYWGRSRLSCYLSRDDLHHHHNYTLLRDDLYVTVDRNAHTIDTIFIIFASVFMLINNINMGAQLDVHIIWQSIKRPVGPIVGFVCQFVFMPLMTFWMGQVFFNDPLHRLGLFTLGCSPGGTTSNFWTLMFDGDLNLSITMTAVSTVAAMGMMPLWMALLGSRVLGDDMQIQVPYANLAISLVSLTLPVAAGLVIRFKRRRWADVGARIIKPFTLVCILIFILLGTYNSYKVFTMMTANMVLAGTLVAATGYAFGAGMACLLCLKRPQIIAISIETAFQNAGVAFILLKLSLPSPDSDLAGLPAMAAMMMVGPPMMLIYGVYVFCRHFFGWCPSPDPAAQQAQKLQHDVTLDTEKLQHDVTQDTEKLQHDVTQDTEKLQHDVAPSDSEQTKEKTSLLRVVGTKAKRLSLLALDSTLPHDSASKYILVLDGFTKRKLKEMNGPETVV